jgi:hypothetical protein
VAAGEGRAMSTDFIKALDGLVAQAAGDWRVFLRKLGPVHAQWHTEHNGGIATLGFLLFHWELINRFKAVGADGGLGGLNGITAYTETQLANFGAPYDVTDGVSAGDAAALEQFSGDVEAWHNDAHMEIGNAVHHNLMNPRTNVRRHEFWQLHYFINDQLAAALTRYAPGAAEADTIATLEADPAVAPNV